MNEILMFMIIIIMSKIIGIYCIRSVSKNKCYIGKSVNVLSRKARHFSELRHGKHTNKKLQRYFSKYGESDFEWILLEEITRKFADRNELKKHLANLEIKYIKKYNSFQDGFNLTKGGDGLKGCGRVFQLQNISSGEIKTFNSFAEAATEIGCNSESSIHAVISGKCNSCKGWCRVGEVKERHTGKYSVNFTLYHPVHGTYTGTNMSEFKRKFQINIDVSSLIKGIRKQCCGWRTSPNKH